MFGCVNWDVFERTAKRRWAMTGIGKMRKTNWKEKSFWTANVIYLHLNNTSNKKKTKKKTDQMFAIYNRPNARKMMKKRLSTRSDPIRFVRNSEYFNCQNKMPYCLSFDGSFSSFLFLFLNCFWFVVLFHGRYYCDWIINTKTYEYLKFEEMIVNESIPCEFARMKKMANQADFSDLNYFFGAKQRECGKNIIWILNKSNNACYILYIYIWNCICRLFFVCLRIMQIFPSNRFRWMTKSELSKEEKKTFSKMMTRCAVSVGRDYCYFCRYAKTKSNWSKSSAFFYYENENLSIESMSSKFIRVNQ